MSLVQSNRLVTMYLKELVARGSEDWALIALWLHQAFHLDLYTLKRYRRYSAGFQDIFCAVLPILRVFKGMELFFFEIDNPIFLDAGFGVGDLLSS